MKTKLFVLYVLACSYLCAFVSDIPKDIQQLINSRVDEGGSTGIAVGLIEGNRVHTYCYGQFSMTDQRKVDENTFFEIGSITKLFTALLLQEKVSLGVFRLSDPVYPYLPQGWTIPEKNGKQITFEHIVTHHAALPYMPTNNPVPSVANPFATYTVEQLRDFFFHYQLPREIGESYEYSNVGYALLGHIFSRLDFMDYEDLVKSKICNPMGMNDTTIQLNKEQQNRLAQGHVARKPVENWDMPALVAAGAFRSTLKDMLIFLRANLGKVSNSMYPYMVRMREKLASTELLHTDIGYGWHIRQDYCPEIFWHMAGTAGYRGFIAICPETERGVIILTNSVTNIDDLGFHMMDSRYSLEMNGVEVIVPRSVLNQYEGIYKHCLGLVCYLYQNQGHLFIRVKGYPEVEARPLSDTKFYIKEAPIELEFETDKNGNMTMIGSYGDQKYYFRKVL